MSTTEALHACECETTLQGWCAAQGRVVQSLAQGGMYHLVLGAGLGGRSVRSSSVVRAAHHCILSGIPVY